MYHKINVLKCAYDQIDHVVVSLDTSVCPSFNDLGSRITILLWVRKSSITFSLICVHNKGLFVLWVIFFLCILCFTRHPSHQTKNIQINTQVQYIAYHYCIFVFLYVNILYVGIYFILSHPHMSFRILKKSPPSRNIYALETFDISYACKVYFNMMNNHSEINVMVALTLITLLFL